MSDTNLANSSSSIPSKKKKSSMKCSICKKGMKEAALVMMPCDECIMCNECVLELKRILKIKKAPPCIRCDAHPEKGYPLYYQDHIDVEIKKVLEKCEETKFIGDTEVKGIDTLNYGFGFGFFPKCKEHDDWQNFFCLDCNEFLCPTCDYDGSHAKSKGGIGGKHNTKPTKVIRKDFEHQFDGFVDEMDQVIKTMEKKLQEVKTKKELIKKKTEEILDDIDHEIEGAAFDMIEKVKKETKDMFDKNVFDEFDTKLGIYKQRADAMENRLKPMREFAEFCAVNSEGKKVEGKNAEEIPLSAYVEMDLTSAMKQDQEWWTSLNNRWDKSVFDHISYTIPVLNLIKIDDLEKVYDLKNDEDITVEFPEVKFKSRATSI